MFKKALLTTIVITGAVYAKDIYPVGTVLHSILPESVFQTKMGNEWVLMDGRVIDSSYEVAKYLSTNDKLENRLPDAQGKFLRMMDYRSPTDPNRIKDGDPEENRQIGSYQGDEFKSHNHVILNHNKKEYERYGLGQTRLVNPTSDFDYDNYTAGEKKEKLTENNGTVETRPKNIAINLFIKIKSCQTTACK